MDVKLFYVSPFQKKFLKKMCSCVSAVASLLGAARPGCHHFGVTPYYDMKPKLHRFVVNTILFSLCLVVPILIRTKNPLIFRRRPFFGGSSHTFGPKTHLFCSKDLFFWSSPIFGTKKGATTKSCHGCQHF